MSYHYTVTTPFEDYKPGDIITDDAAIRDAIAKGHKHRMIRTHEHEHLKVKDEPVQAEEQAVDQQDEHQDDESERSRFPANYEFKKD